jgi:hypothetical protein
MKTNVLLITLLALALCVTPVSAQASESPAQLDYYDAQINVLMPRLAEYQTAYFTTNGKYYQALTSHTTAPDVPTPPDGLSDSPSDQDENLAFFWYDAALPQELAWAFRIDTYSGPDGDGYVLTVTTEIDGGTWTRSINHGPDTWRAADWYLVQPFNF